MIIPALIDYYDLLERDPESDVAPIGFSRQLISFEVVLSPDGSEAEIKDARLPGDKGRLLLRSLVVPGQSKPSGSGINPCFLWDNAQYMLAFKPDDPKPDRTRKAFEAFRDKHLQLRDDIEDAAFEAVCRFLESWSPGRAETLTDKADFLSRFGVFRIIGTEGYVHERPAIAAWYERQLDADPAEGQTERAPSLATGQPGVIARLHEPKIKNVRDAQSSGATIVSFNQDAFESYDKEQGFNAPISEDEAFKYCTALNRLTGNISRRVQIGDTTVVFWAESPSSFESDLIPRSIGANQGEDSKTLAEARTALAALSQGKPVGDINPETRFYILGLAPNAARLSVRLWLTGSIREFAARIEQHLEDLALEPIPSVDPQLTVKRLIAETANPKNGWADEASVSPLLAGAVLRSILTGLPYPRALLSSIINRARIEGLADRETRKDHIAAAYRRCAVIKACLIRNARIAGHTKEIPVSLNQDHPEPAYQLGRLFAALEKTQEDALPGIGATIKDRYFGSASCTPASVFPRLCRMHQHHIEKLEGGIKVNREKLIQEIIGRIDAFPNHLTLNDQGLFAIGYYHQRQSFFTKKEDRPAEPATA